MFLSSAAAPPWSAFPPAGKSLIEILTKIKAIPINTYCYQELQFSSFIITHSDSLSPGWVRALVAAFKDGLSLFLGLLYSLQHVKRGPHQLGELCWQRWDCIDFYSPSSKFLMLKGRMLISVLHIWGIFFIYFLFQVTLRDDICSYFISCAQAS